MGMTTTITARPERVDDRPIRIGVVSFLNTLPLIDGLEGLAAPPGPPVSRSSAPSAASSVQLRHSVPSLLIDQLLSDDDADRVDLALCSSIDYQRSPVPLRIVPVGMLGCFGPTLTVRLYADTPLDSLDTVYCDSDSHTSIALMQIVLAERFNIQPRIIRYNAREHVAEHKPVDWPSAMLLIGDKVVTDSPPAVRYPHQLDLGAAWAEDTGLPFVFAAWMCRADADPNHIAVAAAVLERQRLHNRERIAGMVHRHAGPRNWPNDLASTYLSTTLQYGWSDAHRTGLEQFFTKALEHGLIDACRPIELLTI